MKKGTRGEARVQVDASAERLYELVSDVTRMGEWSPETVGCRWIGGATGPEVGARFKGTNRRRFLRWSTKARVLAAEPGREFAFVVGVLIFGREMTKWRYTFEPAPGGGTAVTESFEMMDDLPWVIAFGERRLMGIRDRRADLEAAMRRTLESLKTAAEAGPGGSGAS